MSSRIKPDEARRRILTEWRIWATRSLAVNGPYTRADAAAFFAFLKQDKPVLLTSLGPEVDADAIHGWLFRNGEVID